MNNKKRVLVTGCGGAIGCHLLAHIMHNTDWDVVATDSFRGEHKGYFDRVTEVCSEHPEWKDRITVIQHNLCAPFTERQIKEIGKVDYIINLASRSDVQASVDDPVSFLRDNTELMINMLEYARAVKPEVFLHFSTDEVYGPAPKDSEGHPEWSTILPSNPYSASKAMQEAMAISYWRTYDVPVVITNTMNNFGEMQAPSKFPAMIQQKLERDEEITVHASGGEIGTRYYLHSRNASDGVLFILKNTKPNMHTFGEIDKPSRYNIVGDKQVSNLDLVHIIADLMGKTPKIKMVDYHTHNAGHDLHYGLDGTLLQELGWTPPMSFEESLQNTIKWHQENPKWYESKDM